MKLAISILATIAITSCILPNLSYAIRAAQVRFWHEEMFESGGDNSGRFKSVERSKVLYPRFKSCKAPLKPVIKTVKHKSEAQWSTFFGLHFFEHGYQFSYWDQERKGSETQSDGETASIVFIIFAFIVYIFLCIFLTPLFGCLVFYFYASIWNIITCPFLRACVRKFWVWNERRKIKTNILLSSGDNSKAVRMRNRVPTFLRKHNDEEYADELLIEELNDETHYSDSSDGFEVEYFTIAKPGKPDEDKMKKEVKTSSKKKAHKK